MAKWYGKVGYITTEKVRPGYWEPTPVERSYFGDVLEHTSRWRSSSNLNDDSDITARISIVADPFAYQNFSNIKYVEYMDTVWEVNSISPQYPRLILNLGGVYNGERPESTTE